VTPRRKFFKNAQWKVTRYGLECRTTGYDIQARTLGHLRGQLPEWPLHMAEKNWVDVRLFVDAFRAAIDLHHVALDAAALDKSCARAIAFGDYRELHDAACDRIVEEQNIGAVPGSNIRCYNAVELLRLCDLADAQLAAAGIHPPEGWLS